MIIFPGLWLPRISPRSASSIWFSQGSAASEGESCSRGSFLTAGLTVQGLTILHITSWSQKPIPLKLPFNGLQRRKAFSGIQSDHQLA